MPATLPEFQKIIDNAFTETWYQIRADAIDQILEAEVLWYLLKSKGCFDTQTGGEIITRTISYDTGPTPVNVDKGDLLPQGTKETETLARWTFRKKASHVQRDIFTDDENQGEFQIANYVERRMRHMINGLTQNYELALETPHTPNEDGKEIQGIRDLLPPPATRTTGTYGLLARPTGYTQGADRVDVATGPNAWHSPRYMQFNANKDVMLLSDMRHFWNIVTNQQETPDVILTTLDLYEQYEDFGLDAIQVAADAKMLDLGFQTVKFKGADLVWTKNCPAGEMRYLNTRHIEVIYSPTMWFEMSEWKQAPLETRRIAHILSKMNLFSPQLRRHGLLYT